MKKLAFQSNIGDWIYYVTTMSFQEINDNVKKVDQELHKSKTLSQMIQRAITPNVQQISHYIQKQKEMFFNAIVLAVYEGDPQWKGVNFSHENMRETNLGILEFTGTEKIFPVDGQHRVEGIKQALLIDPKNEEIKNNEVSVIFIGHNNSDEGMKRTRRLFSTLNRYAKPVSLSEIIALDEDDIVAIGT
ncbi:DNA sulfur modification protein DndB [Peloplasma aerotolerans]|uniref:DNA sulfur modification protein DndB n=1 Tax=Peloplasma aerotolerans TaxID=3044389 RepID=A0AAW6UA25_9MOLU|nr:DNA sulfur modification protein DndB [Mariniplasma sp. M4Ah]MDI6453539.1 DNA sulfur modification protein DndB [Mariniplasma sp. M4Ah]